MLRQHGRAAESNRNDQDGQGLRGEMEDDPGP
jgi:hypothetical protein